MMTLQLPPGKFDGYIFDCDGTIADTMPLHYKAWREALEGSGCDFPEAMFYELGGVPTGKIIEILNERHGTNLPVIETTERKEALYLEMVPLIAPIEPVVELVNRFAGKTPIAVATGGHRHVVLKTLGALGLAGKFQAIVAAEDYVNGKPSPDPFLEAARRLGVEPARCLVFEDTNPGIEAAEAAGMQWVRIPPPERG